MRKMLIPALLLVCVLGAGVSCKKKSPTDADSNHFRAVNNSGQTINFWATGALDFDVYLDDGESQTWAVADNVSYNVYVDCSSSYYYVSSSGNANETATLTVSPPCALSATAKVGSLMARP